MKAQVYHCHVRCLTYIELFRFCRTWAEIQFRDPCTHTSSRQCEERKHSKANDGQGEGAPETSYQKGQGTHTRD